MIPSEAQWAFHLFVSPLVMCARNYSSSLDLILKPGPSRSHMKQGPDFVCSTELLGNFENCLHTDLMDLNSTNGSSVDSPYLFFQLSTSIGFVNTLSSHSIGSKTASSSLYCPAIRAFSNFFHLCL